MGRVSRTKHPSRERSDISSGEESQSILRSHVDKSDTRDFLIPIIKEIGKTIYPPAAISIEVLYQIYKYADAIKEAGSAVMKGDYEQAAKIVVKESIKEASEVALGVAQQPVVTRVSDSLAENAVKSVGRTEQEKETIKRIVKGTVEGVAEATNEKIADEIVDEVFE